MKFCRFRVEGENRFGVLCEGWLLDLNRAVRQIHGESVLREGPLDIQDFTGTAEHYPPPGHALIESVLEWMEQEGHSHPGWRQSFLIDPALVEWLPPVKPSKIIAIGLNYRDHCAEQGLPEPEFPTIFAKFPSALTGHLCPIFYPPQTEQLDYEAELAFVIGKTARHVPEERAYEHIAGYTIVNDVTARDLQRVEKQWVRAKSFDTFAPCGPWLVTPDEIPDPHDLDIRLTVNGEERQHSSTAELVFTVPYLLSYLSHSFTLYPGDVVITGTPGGVGIYRDPPALLQPGDEVEITIEHLGTLTNRVARL